MQPSVGSSGIARLIGAFAALSLSAGPAWAGGAGDLASLEAALDGACTFLQVPMTSCPELPTITQLVLEIAGLESAPPEVPRFGDGIVPTVAISKSNEVTAMMKLIPEPAARTLPESLALAALSCLSSTSTKAPIGIIRNRSKPADFTGKPRLLATIPCDASCTNTATMSATHP